MGSFRFVGEIPGSKSIFNRALIVQSYFSELNLNGYSTCDDVENMRKSLKQLANHQSLQCGEGGTTFRFMTLRASRLPGHHEIFAAKRLFQRPQKGLMDLLAQLGVIVESRADRFIIESKGWSLQNSVIRLDLSESSQFASGLLLNAWLLPFDLHLKLSGDKVSQSYFQLTLEMVRELGMDIQEHGDSIVIPAQQKIKKQEFTIEADLSSAFSIACAGGLCGQSKILNFPEKSVQPDLAFLEVFRQMGVHYNLHKGALEVEDSGLMRGIDFSLRECPDLFPVLAILCSWAEGTSRLFGAPQLVAKESNRILKVAELLNLIGVKYEVKADGMIIHGNPNQALVKSIKYNPDQDHRMAMAAALLKLKGHEIYIEDPEVVNKSFPEFWQLIGVTP